MEQAQSTGQEPSKSLTSAETFQHKLILGFIIFSLIVGFISLSGLTPLYIPNGLSIGLVAAIISGIVAAVTAVIFRSAVNNQPEQQWRKRYFLTKTNFDTVVVLAMHAWTSFLITLGAFAMFQWGFPELELDRVSGAILCALTAALCCVVVSTTSALTGSYNFVRFAVAFISIGAIAAMLMAHDATWWRRDFSELGGMGTTASMILNVTLIIAGPAVMCVGDYLAADLHRANQPSLGRKIIHWMFVVIGFLLMWVGIIPVSYSRPIHVNIAMTMAFLLVIMTAIAPFAVPGMSKSFVWLSRLASVTLLTLIIVGRIFGLLPWTAVEVESLVIIGAWLLGFIRQINGLRTWTNPSEAQRIIQNPHQESADSDAADDLPTVDQLQSPKQRFQPH